MREEEGGTRDMHEPSPQAASGSLSMIVIRACKEHGPQCEEHRTFENKGIVASFGDSPPPEEGRENGIDRSERG